MTKKIYIYLAAIKILVQKKLFQKVQVEQNKSQFWYGMVWSWSGESFKSLAQV